MANRTRLLTAAALGLACWVSVPAARAQQQSTVAVINQQAALMNTKDGQAAVKELTTKYTPKQKDLEARQAQLQQLNSQLQAGGATLAPEKRTELQRQLEDGGRTFTRDRDDLRDQYQADQQRLLVPVEQRMQAVISKYAQQKGFALVLDSSGPVVFASPTIDITKEIIAAFDSAPAVAPMNVPPPSQQKPAPPKPITPK
jgi:outer membrane protein